MVGGPACGVPRGIAALTGPARDFFLLGIRAALAGCSAAFGSLRAADRAAWNLLPSGKHTPNG